jgi:predicted methyltransferase
MSEAAKDGHKDEKGLLKIYESIKGKRYFSSVEKDTLKKEFERGKLSNFVEILRHYRSEGILDEKEGKIHFTTKGIRYIREISQKQENK